MTKNNFATKSDIKVLKSNIQKLETRLEIKIDNQVNSLKADLRDTKLEILAELQTMREEDAAHQYSHVRTDEELEDHEKRLRLLGSLPS